MKKNKTKLIIGISIIIVIAIVVLVIIFTNNLPEKKAEKIVKEYVSAMDDKNIEKMLKNFDIRKFEIYSNVDSQNFDEEYEELSNAYNSLTEEEKKIYEEESKNYDNQVKEAFENMLEEIEEIKIIDIEVEKVENSEKLYNVITKEEVKYKENDQIATSEQNSLYTILKENNKYYIINQEDV